MKKILTLVALCIISLSNAQTISLLKDVNVGTPASDPTGFVVYNNMLYFGAYNFTSGGEFWVSDGTPGGTTLAFDFVPGSGGIQPQNLIVYNNFIYYSYSDAAGTFGTELWRTDGTAAGTALVADINPGANSSYPAGFYVFNNELYFTADNGIVGTELWKTDGSPVGTVLVKDINPGPNSSNVYEPFFSVANKLFFSANDGTTGNELWVSDGTDPGTYLVMDINPGINGSYYSGNGIVYANKFYFNADNGVNGTELWASDGTAPGTSMIKDIYAGSNGGYPYSFHNGSDGYLYFTANDGVTGSEIWKSDGTTPGTNVFIDAFVAPTAMASIPYYYNGYVYFQGSDMSGIGTELYRTDGTIGGTSLVKDINPGTGSSEPSKFFEFDNKLFFQTATNAGTNREIAYTDGTTLGTHEIDVFPGTNGSNPNYITFYNGKYYFSASSQSSGMGMGSAEPHYLSPNAAPIMQDVVDSTLCEGILSPSNILGPLNFTASDDGGNASITFSAISDNTTLITNITTTTTVTGGTITFTVSPTLSGTANITLTATDQSGASSNQTIVITVNPKPIVSAGQDANICLNSNTSLNATGATSFVWLPSTALSCSNCANPTAAPLATTIYTVTGTDGNNCVNTDEVSVFVTQALTQEICAVTVDSISTHNVIFWEKPVTTAIDSFFVYREDATNVYTHIGTVAYDSLSEYHDNGVDPNVTTKRYKISVLDTCGNEGPKSNYHNTIYIIHVGAGQFTWNPIYTIENNPNPVANYVLMRDNISDGNWFQIASTAGTQNTIVDPAYSSFPTGRWRVEAQWGITCTSTRGAINTTRSNIKSPSSIGINELKSLGEISIKPNPATNQIEISFAERNATLLIHDELGRMIAELKTQSAVNTIDVTNYASGVYTIKLVSNKGMSVTKFVKQ
ncbi:MAG: T9SS type A sorting domain-containing protein [Bacteroidetes bacterium]|nr:T9SS type A sorting domain-containing protein [Bacteroidota bacterium]